jgi:hypothetical protein
MAPTVILQGDGRLVSAQVAIAGLSRALRIHKQVALVRFVKKDDADPYLAALVPETEDSGVLLVHHLPCIEDTRIFEFPPLYEGIDPAGYPNTGPYKALGRVIDGMTIVDPPRRLLTPFNPALQCVQSMLRTKLDVMGASASTLPEAIFDHPIEITPAVTAYHKDSTSAKLAVGRLGELFELRLVDQTGDKKRTFWSDVNISGEVVGEESVEVKKAKGQVKVCLEYNIYTYNIYMYINKYICTCMCNINTYTSR